MFPLSQFIHQESTFSGLLLLSTAARSELAASQAALARATSHRFLVAPGARCCQCRRRIGTSAFVRYPSTGELAHYGCCRDLPPAPPLPQLHSHLLSQSYTPVQTSQIHYQPHLVHLKKQQSFSNPQASDPKQSTAMAKPDSVKVSSRCIYIPSSHSPVSRIPMFQAIENSPSVTSATPISNQGTKQHHGLNGSTPTA
ncbi:unnamed protein product [Protopolystoma xenopodis]|uniref:Vacuolar sorting protein 39/Transforming growth factor beta receptor-associated zinc finger domain-containing protein n=1 Tax=Protopolystoma xenopodis TaxID=117903 RepID=A0A3S5CD91_9PLAT|nr:unnamed protein product [Protopolystoma xenopodis]